MGIRISAEREIEDPRKESAIKQPHRNHFWFRPDIDPLDKRLECPLGRLLLEGRLSDAEYDAGCRWRTIYNNWLRSIGSPSQFAAAIDYRNSDMVQDDTHSDSEFNEEQAEAATRIFKTGEKVLKSLGRRVFDSVNAIAVYEEPQGLGDFESTVISAKRGLFELAVLFGDADRSDWKTKPIVVVVRGKKCADRDSGLPLKRGPLSRPEWCPPQIIKKTKRFEHQFDPRLRSYPDEEKPEFIYQNRCSDL